MYRDKGTRSHSRKAVINFGLHVRRPECCKWIQRRRMKMQSAAAGLPTRYGC
jgi:hypothetical protein